MLEHKYYKIYITIFKIFGLWTINLETHNTCSVNKGLVIYSLSWCVVLFALHIHQHIFLIEPIQIIVTSALYIAQVFAIVTTIINDKKIANLLKYLIESKVTKTNLVSHASKRYLHRFAIGFMLYTAIFIANTFALWYYRRPRTVLIFLYYVMMLCHFVSFGKVTLVLSEFIDVLVRLNIKTEDFVSKKQDIKELYVTYVTLEEKLLEGNKMLNPLLLTNVMTNFLNIFMSPYDLANSLDADQYSWVFSSYVRLLAEIIKLFTLSRICEDLVSEFSEWWNIICTNEGSQYVIEMHKCGIVTFDKKVSIEVYNMFALNKNYTTTVLITTLNYAFLILQNLTAYQNFMKS